MNSELQAPSFNYALRIYYEDTDAAGMVYYANYLRFMERARSEWLRVLGFQQSQLVASHGIAFVARSAQIDYLRPARLDDELILVNRIRDVGRAQVSFDQRVVRVQTGADACTDTRDAELLAHGVVRIACIQPATGRPTALPPDMLQAFRQLLPDT